MDANSSDGTPAGKPTIPSGAAGLVLRLLRMYWLTELILLALVVYGLRAGWITSKQWRDGFFLAAVAQVLFAGLTLMGGVLDPAAASSVRFVPGGDLAETRTQMVLASLEKQAFGVKVFFGGLFTFLIAVLVSRA